MENQQKKKNTSEVDEEFLMSMMSNGRRNTDQQKMPTEFEPVAHEIQETKAKKRTKKNTDTDYETLFFKNPGTNARNGKSVYIRPEFHERLTRIVQVIGEDKLTIYAYLDNVLEHHFQEFAQEITTSFNDKYKPIL